MGLRKGCEAAMSGPGDVINLALPFPWREPAACRGETDMARKPNFDFERQERDKAKAAKKAAKLDARTAKKEEGQPEDAPADTEE